MIHGFDLVGIGLYPLGRDQIPQELTSPHAESALLSIQAQLMLSEYLKYFLKIFYMSWFLFTLYYHIVNVYFYRAPNFLSKHPCHHLLVRGSGVLQPKWHYVIVIVCIRGNECCLFSVLGCQGNLVIPLKGVQEAHPRVSVCSIYQLINLGHWERLFRTCPF